MFSLIVPVYKNVEGFQALIEAIEKLSRQLDDDFEAVLVVDGWKPDAVALVEHLRTARFRSQMLVLSRNFGSFAAIRAGLERARGSAFAVMSADLQEPPEVVLAIADVLRRDAADVVVGVRTERRDSLLTRMFSRVFWSFFKRFINTSIPAGGVDIFGCNARVRTHLLALAERNSSLVALLFWIGFRREEIPYARRRREHGKSAWTFRRKWRYFSDSLYSFSDLPIRLVGLVGVGGMAIAIVLGAIVLYAKLQREIPIPGYTATVLAIMFFGGLNAFAAGVLGGYIWRTFENTKGRPSYIVMDTEDFGATQAREEAQSDDSVRTLRGPR